MRVSLAPGVPEMGKRSFLHLPSHQQLEHLLPQMAVLIAAAGSASQGTVIVFLNTHLSQVLGTIFKLEVHRQRNGRPAGERLS